MGETYFVGSPRKNELQSLKLNSVALVRKQTIPTERPQHVGEFSADFLG
jgi:hypothetical protein